MAKGELKSKINVKVDKASAGAVKAVEKASGKVEIIENSKA
ncbi:MAG: uL15 family ribosomal protein [Candidatus Peribacteria bacterium]|nr:uL15 family ribosomal protein [Candidatus Peribacteria bacterium]